MTLFRVLLAFDVLVAAVIAAVFCVGLADAIAERHVDAEDLLLWPPLLTALGAVLGGGWWLRSKGRVGAANGVLLVVAVPGLAAGAVGVVLLAMLARPGAWR